MFMLVLSCYGHFKDGVHVKAPECSRAVDVCLAAM
jgi:hypothetical protein